MCGDLRDNKINIASCQHTFGIVFGDVSEHVRTTRSATEYGHDENERKMS